MGTGVYAMSLARVLPYTKQLLESVIEPGDCVVDMTAGNGHDTQFLAECVGPEGRVLAFDVQAQAIEESTRRLDEAGMLERVDLYHESHIHVGARLSDERRPVRAGVFNLGYLPGSDKSITTTGEETLEALDALLPVLAPGGLVVLVVYHGHLEGKRERDAVLDYVTALDQQGYAVLQYRFLNQQNHPPFIIAIEKKVR
ncbi:MULTISPECIES: class I SAM-dependent methyltransferase [Exiguobacterium]|uniref:class I SAM-dependent methyltransferase n=1 Tax=Exiguobacterium TaxID=33986 RepID=UPI002100A4D2|nr:MULTISPECIES: class I SAM-dependent methyltransferase [Exiguobacterium]MDQ6467538.1 class I SAM-dependent methyltransferase [Exiguobacterium acetylicum]MDT0172425.1 class I SAM-dependent methyltransferase [Exiguobacterium sp. BRG2]